MVSARSRPRMPTPALALTALALALALSTALAGAPSRCRRPRRLDAAFCRRPPALRRLALPAYMGKWYGIWNAGFATTTSSNQCVTVNYALRTRRDGGGFDGLLCDRRPPQARPRCLRSTWRPGRGPARFVGSFGPGAPPQPYAVAAVLGRPSYGYHAAAVYACFILPDGKGGQRLVTAWAIIARTPWAPSFVLKRLVSRIRCAGYRVRYQDFKPVAHPPSCRYEQGPGTFQLDTPRGIPR